MITDVNIGILFVHSLPCMGKYLCLSLYCLMQAMRWGEVEWHHSVEESDLRSRLAAAVVLKELANSCNIMTC